MEQHATGMSRRRALGLMAGGAVAGTAGLVLPATAASAHGDIQTYGAHNDDRVSEAHNNGRGFDLSRIYATGTDGDLHRRFFARHDIWKDWTGDAFTEARRHYWATAASAHHHFRNVLTYLYNADHDNHIHIDNLVSGTSNSEFDTGSEAQVQHVQACCRC